MFLIYKLHIIVYNEIKINQFKFLNALAFRVFHVYFRPFKESGSYEKIVFDEE